MCGGGTLWNPPKKPVGWRKVMAIFNAEGVNSCIFVEVTTGCWNTWCPFQCSARKHPYKVQITPEQLSVVGHVFKTDVPKCLFGYGETSKYPYGQMTDINKVPSCLQLSMIPSHVYVDELPDALLTRTKVFIFSVYNRDDVLAANRLYRDIKSRLSALERPKKYFVKIPVLRGFLYFEMAGIVNGPEVLFHGISVNSDKHISRERFVQESRKYYGITPYTKDIPDMTTPGFKPVIERVEGVREEAEITLRRCFKIDSSKITISIKGGWDRYDDEPVSIEQANEFMEFLTFQPPCDTCTLQTWRAW